MRTTSARVTALLTLILVLDVSTVLARDARGPVVVEEATVTRSSSGEAVVQWRTTPAGASIDIAILMPDERRTRLVSDNDTDGTFKLHERDAARRPLVHLTTESGVTFITAERLLPLEGGRNFRDLGGYRTQGGQRVKWGQVYRSGTMTSLTDADYRFLSTLNIRVVCDFRANEERNSEPTRWRAAGPQIEYLTRDYTTTSGLRSVLNGGEPTPEQVRTAMLRTYEALPYEHAASYRRMFKSLAAGQAPLAFNCSAGKDRTGVAAALLLTMLDVPRETIAADYALSERVVNYEAAFAPTSAALRTTQPHTSQPGPWDFMAKLPADVRAPLLRSDPDYIRAALGHIERREGSIDDYFMRVLGLSAEEQHKIRAQLLE